MISVSAQSPFPKLTIEQTFKHTRKIVRDTVQEHTLKAQGVVDSVFRVLKQLVMRGGAVVVAHHPFVSGGQHGGHFTWQDHIFPLRAIAPWLWIPLPWLGSLYPAARREGISSQDMPSIAYQRLIAALRRAFTGAAPALYAAGHEHNLQVIADGPARLELVSGGGIYGHYSAAVRIHGTRFARKASRSG